MIHRTQTEPEFKLGNRISNKAPKPLPRAVQWTRQDSPMLSAGAEEKEVT